MRILFFEDSSQSIYGGGQKISKIIFDKLKDDNFLILIDFGGSKKFHNDIYESIDILYNLKASFHKNKILQRISQLFYLIINFYKVVKIVLKTKPNILYTTTKMGIVYSYFFNIFFGVKFIYHAHMSMEKSIVNLTLCLLLRRSTNVIAVSKYVKKTIHERSKNINIIVVYNPIEFNVRSLNINKTEILNFSFFGTLKTEKGIHLIIETALFFNKNNPKLKFLIYGDGPLMSYLKNINIPNLFICGYVDNVEYLLDSTDVLLLPSIIPEACPTIILQAMSKGIPSITSNIGGQKELVKDRINGVLMKNNNLESLINNILLLNDDIEFYNLLANNNLSEIKKYNSMAEYEIQIKNILNESITVR